MRSTKRVAIRNRYITLHSMKQGSVRYCLLEGEVAESAARVRVEQGNVEKVEAALRALLTRRARWRSPKEVKPRATAGREFDALVRHPDVTGVTVCGRRLTFTTVPVTLEDEGETYAIGRFRVTIRTDALANPVRMVNLTRKVSGCFDHPFVDSGVPDDNLLADVCATELWDSGRYGVIAFGCLNFLKFYSEVYAWKCVDYWPCARRQTRRTKVPRVARHSPRLRAYRARYLTLRGMGPDGGRYYRLLQQIAAQRAELECLRTRLRTAERRHAEAQAIFERSKERAIAGLHAQKGIEFDRLCEHPDIARIRVWGEKIFIWTRPVVLPFHGRWYQIGQFRITIPADGTIGIRMVNLWRTSDDLQHPQGIYQYERVCFGDLTATVARLLWVEQNYAAVINLCLYFLHNWGDGIGRNSERWPIVPRPTR